MDPKLEKLKERISLAHMGGGQKRIDKQHQKQKLTARERVNYLLDEGSFEEMGILVTHRTTDFGMDKDIYLGDDRIRNYQWKVSICVCSGFYCIWRRFV